MTWEVRIPFRDRGDSLIDVIDEARHFEDPEEAAAIRELAMEAHLNGAHTAGDPIDRLGAAGKAGRRRMLDDARERAGLERTEDIDSRERFRRTQEVVQRNSSGRDQEGKAIQVCGAEGCKAMSADPSTGALVAVSERQWWCGEHRDQAGPDDHLPPDDVWAVGPHFEVIPSPSEQRRLQAEDDRHREEREREAQGRRAEREAIRKAEERYFEQHRDDPFVNPLSGPGWAGKT